MRNTGEGTARFFMYIFGKALAVALAAALVVGAFYTALATTNVQVVVKDAFAKRASVILEPIDNNDTALLDKIFTREYLNESKLDTQKTNKDYVITNFIQRTDADLAIVWPWMTEVTIQVKDVVDGISARLTDTAGSNYQAVDKFIENGIYQVTLVKQDGSKWLVSDIKLLESVTSDKETPVPTPTPMQSIGEEGEEDFSVDDKDYEHATTEPEGSVEPE